MSKSVTAKIEDVLSYIINNPVYIWVLVLIFIMFYVTTTIYLFRRVDKIARRPTENDIDVDEKLRQTRSNSNLNPKHSNVPSMLHFVLQYFAT